MEILWWLELSIGPDSQIQLGTLSSTDSTAVPNCGTVNVMLMCSRSDISHSLRCLAMYTGAEELSTTLRTVRYFRLAHAKSWAQEYAWTLSLSVKAVFFCILAIPKLENMGMLLNSQVFCCACTNVNPRLRHCASPLCPTLVLAERKTSLCGG